MNTAILSLVLTSMLLTGRNAAPAWQVDYQHGLQQTATQKKPLVVIFGSGSNAWAKVVQGANSSDEIVNLLDEKFLSVYVDTTNPSGKKLASQFAIQGNGIVISSRDGSTQAFWHQGDLSSQNFVRYLQKYSDPQLVVNGTETVPVSAVQPVTPAPVDSYCPNCQNVSRFRR